MNTIVLEAELEPTTTVDELDQEEDKPYTNVAPPPSMPAYRPAAVEPASPSHSGTSGRILTRLLSMADAYRESGSLRQAVEMYFELIREHGDTTQGHRAEERLFDVARYYERSGELRQARGIYEQLL